MELDESANGQISFGDSSKISVKKSQDSNLAKEWELSTYLHLLCSENEEQSPQLRTTTREGIHHPYGRSLPLYQKSKEETN